LICQIAVVSVGKELGMPCLKCGASLALLFALWIPVGFAQSGIITTYAGPGLPVNGESAVNQSIVSLTEILALF
jgi:hypothetical protein